VRSNSRSIRRSLDTLSCCPLSGADSRSCLLSPWKGSIFPYSLAPWLKPSAFDFRVYCARSKVAFLVAIIARKRKRYFLGQQVCTGNIVPQHISQGHMRMSRGSKSVEKLRQKERRRSRCKKRRDANPGPADRQPNWRRGLHFRQIGACGLGGSRFQAASASCRLAPPSAKRSDRCRRRIGKSRFGPVRNVTRLGIA
jgi:hypothetical protein